MRIWVCQVRKKKTARYVARRLFFLADTSNDQPVRKPEEWLGSMPGLGVHPKIYELILHPHSEEMHGWPLARKAMDILEKRHGVKLDWACGYDEEVVHVLIKPWGIDMKTGKKVWFSITPDDLKELRKELSLPRKKKTKSTAKQRARK